MLTIRHRRPDGAWTRVDPDAFEPEAIGPLGWWWLDLDTPSDAEAAVLDRLGLHPLIMEDMTDERHLPKVEVLEDQLNLIVHGLRLDEVTDPATSHTPQLRARHDSEVHTTELDIALAGPFLVTWHERPMAAIEAVGRHVDAGRADDLGRPAQLVHRLLDALSDVMVPFIEHFEERLGVIEDDLLTEPTDQTRADLFHLKRDVIQLRRVVVPQAEVLRRLERDAHLLLPDVFEASDTGLLQDVYDHLYRMTGLSESYQQMIDSAMTSYRAAQDDQLNEMLRILTLVSTLGLPLTLLGTVWGMNFIDMPLTERPSGFWAVVAVAAVVMVSMFTWFRQRGWIGDDAERAATQRRAGLRSTLDVPLLGTVLRIPVSGVRAVSRTGRRLRLGSRDRR